MMTHTTRTHRTRIPGFARLAALVLTALTLCAFLAVRPVRAAEWMTPYLEQVQEWGVMRGDAQGNLNEDRNITRAEFVTLVNRAFGYTDTGPNTFTDVNPNDWFAEDISIAHQAGYFNGTSPTTASPYALVTREQAAVFLGRCLRFQGVAGAANSTFTDMHDIGGWSRGLVQEAADLGIIQGYADGSFRPDLPITRGQMACFLVRALGTLVQEPGEQTSGGVYGNLTITTPGVKLKDTTVTGNLYLTGGVGLGNVELENVNVLGKIVICGGGEAEGGKQSVLLRNVTAGSLELDSLTEQFLSVQAEGLTNIAEVTIRTSGYVEDRTEDGLGFQTIRLDGIDGARLQLAGNIKRVIDLTPNSILQVAQGVADMVTIDEKAVNASLSIDGEAVIRELNLDRGTPVTGNGSISHLNINAAGSNVSMLPDTIYVRPGINGIVNNQTMDTNAAAASSEDPRLLAGYPKARNIAPTSADAVFRTNKTGTIHWAVTALMDGSLGEEELMNPGSYAKIIRSGTLNATAPNTDFTARLTGLTREGSYYISALLVDARGRRSPVKIAAFTTPDDSAPNFANGYPQNPILTVDADNEQVAQVMVMATKDCQMYYVLLPRGSAAPTPADFRSAALPGNLGYGIVTLRKNTPFLLSRINTSHLQEQTQYDLYLWLNDADNGKSSAVRRLQFTTRDMTPPTIQDLHVVSFTGSSVTLSFMLDEPGTFSWAAVTKDESIRVNKENPTTNDQIKIENILVDGKTVIRRGGPVRAARAATAYSFTVTGLQGQTSYDLYYMAKDTAGNYCVYNKAIAFPFPIRTQDNQAPTVDKRYSHSELDEEANIEYAYLDSDISLVFSEEVQGYTKLNTGADGDPDNFHDLYSAVLSATPGGDDQVSAKNALASALERHITLHTGTAPGRGEPSKDSYVFVNKAGVTAEELAAKPAWIDYREAVVTRENGQTVITFPAGKGIQLQSGTRYYFYVKQVQDTAPTPNKLASASVPIVSISARVDINDNPDGYIMDGREMAIFKLDPNEATAFSPESARWDLILWAHADIEYHLYVRRIGGEWHQLTGEDSPIRAMVTDQKVYHSLYGRIGAEKMISSGFFGMEAGHQGLPYLRDLSEVLEFGILSTEGGQDGNVKMEVELYTGTNSQLSPIVRSGQGTQDVFNRLPAPLERISNPKAYEFIVPSGLSPTVTLDGTIDAGDTSATFTVNLDLSGRVYCLAVPVRDGGTDTNYSVEGGDRYLPKQTAASGLIPLSSIPQGLATETTDLRIKHPEPADISHPPKNLPTKVVAANTGTELFDGGGSWDIKLPNLEPNRTYILYLVSADTEDNPSETVLCYKFTTTPPNPPVINITPGGTTANIQFKDVDGDPLNSVMAYVLVRSDYFTTVANNVFSQPMSNYKDPNKTLPSGFPANGTVLDAMSQAGNSAGNSVFDVCASETAKQTFSDIIKSTFNQVFLVDGRPYYHSQHASDLDSTNPSGYTDQNLIFNFTDSDEYVLLVAARGTNSTALGFRASWTYQKAQARYLTLTTSRPVPDDPDANTFTGTVYLIFNDPLRYRQSNVNGSGGTSIQTRLPIDTCSLSHSLHSADNENHIGSNGCTNLFFITFGDGVSLTSPPLNPLTNTQTHGSTIGNNMSLRLSGVRQGALVINFGDRITGATTANRDGVIPPLMVTLERDEAGWYLDYNDAWRG